MGPSRKIAAGAGALGAASPGSFLRSRVVPNFVDREGVLRMPTGESRPAIAPHRVNRREFLTRVGWGGAGVAALVASPRRIFAQGAAYPDWAPASPKPPKRGGALNRASAWDPPVLDPRLTNSVGLFQIASLVCNRLVRFPFSDEASNTADLTLKGDLAESWQSSPDFRVWTFKLRQGVKWHNVPPVNGREFVAADVKYCFEAYAKEGIQSFTFKEIEGMETPDKYTVRMHLNMPNVIPADPGRGGGRPLPARGAGAGRRSEEADGRHRALRAEGVLAESPRRARQEP